MWHWQTPAIPVIAAVLAAFLPAPAESATDIDQAFAAVVRTAADPAWQPRLRHVTDPSVTTALAAFARPAECEVAALGNSSFLHTTLAQLDPADRAPYLEGLLAHEMGHCAERYAGDATGPVKAQAVASDFARAGEASAQVQRAELLADIYMGLYLADRHADRADRLMRFHLKRRALASDIDPDHNSARFLRVEHIERRSGESMLQAALRIRDAVTPAR